MSRSVVFIALALASLSPRLGAADSIQECSASYEKAQELKLGHKLRDALAELATCSQQTCPSAIRRDCTGWMTDVSRAIPSIVIEAGGAHGTFSATLDGAPLVLDGTPIEVDPGAHHVVVTDAESHEAASANVSVVEGEKNKHVLVTLPAPIEAAPQADAAPKKPRPPWYTWAIGGVGVAGIISSVAWGTAALVLQNDLRSSCYGSCSAIDVERVHNRALVSDISLGIGIVGLGVAAALFFWPRSVPAPVRALVDGVRF